MALTEKEILQKKLIEIEDEISGLQDTMKTLEKAEILLAEHERLVKERK